MDQRQNGGISISYCPHARALTDINDRGKVGRPSNGRGRSPRLYEGNRLPEVINVGYCPSCVGQ